MSLDSFLFIDKITEVKKNESLTALFKLKGTEEFLQDHFSGFPVMPGVLLLESLKQAASLLLALSGDFQPSFFRLAAAEEIKFGQFVRPGNILKISVCLTKKQDRLYFFDGRIDLDADGVQKSKVLLASFALTAVEPVSAKEKADLELGSRSVYEKTCPVV